MRAMLSSIRILFLIRNLNSAIRNFLSQAGKTRSDSAELISVARGRRGEPQNPVLPHKPFRPLFRPGGDRAGRLLGRDPPRQFALVARRLDRARVDEDVAARQREGVDLRRRDDEEPVLEAVARGLIGEPLAESLDVMRGAVVAQQRQLPRDLFGGQSAEFDVLFGAEEVEARADARRPLRATLVETDEQTAARRLQRKQRDQKPTPNIPRTHRTRPPGTPFKLLSADSSNSPPSTLSRPATHAHVAWFPHLPIFANAGPLSPLARKRLRAQAIAARVTGRHGREGCSQTEPARAREIPKQY